MNPRSNISPAEREALLLEQCCTQLEGELARQVRVLEACKEQGRAARTGEIDALNRVTREMSTLAADGLRAEGARQALSARLATHFGLAPGDVKLSTIVAHAPDPWRGRLASMQTKLKETLTIARRLAHGNGRFLRNGVRTADRILTEVFGPVMAPKAYDSDGRQPARSESVSAVLNVAG